MVITTLHIRGSDRSQGTDEVVEIRLASGYGRTAAEAHEMLLLCLTASEEPVIVDSGGDLWLIPVENVSFIMTRDAER